MAGPAKNKKLKVDGGAAAGVSLGNPLFDKLQRFLSDSARLHPSLLSPPVPSASPPASAADSAAADQPSWRELRRRALLFSPLLPPDERASIWERQADLGEESVAAHSWACPPPDDRIVRIFREFSPTIEIGCGAGGYWARHLAARGVDAVGYDVAVTKRKSDATVRRGGPEVLPNKSNRGRTLFLCYPDEDVYRPVPGLDDGKDGLPPPVCLGEACLRIYGGRHVIHVGELHGDSLDSSSPYGRSTGAATQAALHANFHCILRVALPGWLHVRDTLSIWRRTEICPIVFGGEESGAEDGDGDDGGDEEVGYRHIPPEEQMPVDAAAPCVAHLLSDVDCTEGAKGGEGEGGGNIVAKETGARKGKAGPERGASNATTASAPIPVEGRNLGRKKKKKRKSVAETDGFGISAAIAGIMGKGAAPGEEGKVKTALVGNAETKRETKGGGKKKKKQKDDGRAELPFKFEIPDSL